MKALEPETQTASLEKRNIMDCRDYHAMATKLYTLEMLRAGVASVKLTPYAEDILNDMENDLADIESEDGELSPEEEESQLKIALIAHDIAKAEIGVGVTAHVCPTCKGHGKVVNPGIDRDGITDEDFDNDPDFRESYFNGIYDIECPQCQGKRVVFEPNLGPWLKAFLDELQERINEDLQEREREARYGY